MKTNLLLLLILISPGISLGQLNKSPGIGASAGITNYMGDLDDNFTLKFSRPGFGVHILKPVYNRVSVRANLFRGWITANDAMGALAQNQARNLNFKSPVTELGINVLLYMRSNARKIGYNPKLNPYAMIGVAVFKFNPKGTANGITAPLQPLGTEGQYIGNGIPYRLTQISVPVGGGIHYRVSKMVLVGIEAGLRKTFTDYLDDVSGFYPDQGKLAETNPVAASFSNKTGHDVEAGSL